MTISSESKPIVACSDTPYVDSSHGTCDYCEKPIWVADSTVRKLTSMGFTKADALLVCIKCSIPTLAKIDDLTIAPFSDEQKQEIEAILRREHSLRVSGL